jgi:hypothetical protein
MSDDADAQDYGRPPEPNRDLKSLDRLVGTWEMSGDVQGRVSFEWMEGGFFLIQRVDLGRAKGLRASRSSGTNGPSGPSRART